MPSSANVVALGFSLSKRSSLAKSLSLIVLELGTDFVSSTRLAYLASSPGPPLSFFHLQEETRERAWYPMSHDYYWMHARA